MNRIYKRVALRISILFLLVVIVASVFTGVYLDNAYKTETRELLEKNALVVEQIILSSGGAYPNVLEQIDTIDDMRITVIAEDGMVLFDSRADAETLENHADRPEVMAALRSGEGADVRFSETLGRDMMYVALRSDSLGAVIRVALLLEGVSAYSADLWAPLIVLIGVAFLLCLSIALFVSRSVTTPIIRLRDDMARIADGRYDGLSVIRTGDEIESLSKAICDTAQTLKRNFGAIMENSSRLEAVFRAVPGGIVAVDDDMHIIMANPAARRMFSMSNAPEGRHFLEVTRYGQLETVVQEAAASPGVIEREMTLLHGRDETVLQVFAVNASGYGVILLVQDITRLRRLETLRRDFAANVSHELKTPLTVIRGFADTLKDDTISREDAARFIEIILIEAERLSRLIDDILLLSEIENAPPAPHASCDLRQGITEALELLTLKAQEKNVALTVDMAEAPVLTAMEKDRVKQMAINLIDNAIKYTPNGGSVHVSVRREGEEGVLVVRDTGIGIPEENLPRLFERFYRVDKSRSRALGGTGLGLAIVKHIVNLVDGRITVSSKVGEGSEFCVRLPLAQTALQDG